MCVISVTLRTQITHTCKVVPFATPGRNGHVPGSGSIQCFRSAVPFVRCCENRCLGLWVEVSDSESQGKQKAGHIHVAWDVMLQWFQSRLHMSFRWGPKYKPPFGDFALYSQSTLGTVTVRLPSTVGPASHPRSPCTERSTSSFQRGKDND